MGKYIIDVDESEIVECWNEQAVKEIGYQEYALKKCPEIKVKIYNPTGDCISREALKEAINSTIEQATKVGIMVDADYIWSLLNYAIDNAPTVEPDLEFAKWVTNTIFDSGVEDFDFELFSELACRKLEKMGLVEKTESEWKMKGGTE